MQTLAYALCDSPVGTAAWVWARRRAWSDCGGNVESVYSRDFLCTTASIYWLTNTIGTSLRFYKTLVDAPRVVGASLPRIDVPAGYAIFPKDLVFCPRSVAEAHINVRRWSIFPSGGHFAAAEQPQIMVNELREFFRPLRAI